jgi:Xaa-Pro aminopeptidase
MNEHALRRERLGYALEEAELDALFLPLSSDLEYLTGIERDLPSFGETAQAHAWLAGAFFVPGHEPVCLLPRMFAAFHLRGDPPRGLVVVDEADDPESALRAAVHALGPIRRLGIGQRTWGESVLQLQRILAPEQIVDGTPVVRRLRAVKSDAELALMHEACRMAEQAMASVAPSVVPGVTLVELLESVEHELRKQGSRTPSFPTHLFTFGDKRLDTGDRSGLLPLEGGEAVMFDFGAVHDGYCSDFGRTIVCGEPPAGYLEAYEVMLAAQEAGREAMRPGVRAADVNRACREPIEAAGFGTAFRHRMGHAIGLDVHERPFLSVEDETVLEAGMTFTDEPSILIDGRFGVRIEDVIVCAEPAARYVNEYSRAPVVT